MRRNIQIMIYDTTVHGLISEFGKSPYIVNPGFGKNKLGLETLTFCNIVFHAEWNRFISLVSGPV